jgi:parallel beta-helix repeat protein
VKGEKRKAMKISKIILIILCLTALCVVNTQQVKSQNLEIIYISSDGIVFSSANTTVPILREGNKYTFTDDVFGIASFVVQRSNIIIDGAGFNLAGEGDIGIDVSVLNNVTIKNVNLMGGFYNGIYLVDSSSITIIDNTITGNYEGVFLYNSVQNTIDGNSISNNQIGIDLQSSPNNLIINNNLNNGYNFAVYGSDLSHFINDIDASNTVNGKKVYYLVNTNNQVVGPDTYPDAGFVALIGCTNITVRDLELSNNGQGILLAYTTSSTIGQNSITNNYNGILLFRSSNNIISSNNIRNNYRGIQFSNSSNSNSITANNISDNTNGLFLFESSQNAITGNNITDNGTGIGFRVSLSNRIYTNYFVNNDEQVYDYYLTNSSITQSLNFWSVSYQIGGNYWSDYKGVDVKSGPNQNQTGSDNIGDSPYILYGSNKDDFPLLPYGSPPVISISSPQSKAYLPGTDVTLNFTVSEETSWIKYSLDGQANVTITGIRTLSGLAEGTHTITVYAEDLDGFAGMSETITFTVSEDAEPTETESIPITWIAGAIIIMIGAALLIYMFRIKKK